MINPRHVSAYDDDFEDLPASGWFAQWVGGAIVPLFLIGYGIMCVVTQHGVLIGHGSSLDLHGSRAVALGIAVLSAGLFLHCHYFWGNLYHLAVLAVVGKLLSLVGIIAGLGYLIVQVGIWGRT